MILERGVAGGVVVHVVSGPQTFAGVERNFRGLATGFAARRTRCLGTLFGVLLAQGFVIPFLLRQQKFRKRLPLEHAEEKGSQHDRRDDSSHIQNAPKSLPAFALRVVEDLLIHLKSNDTGLRRGEAKSRLHA